MSKLNLDISKEKSTLSSLNLKAKYAYHKPLKSLLVKSFAQIAPYVSHMGC